jgi:hypothetical protein
MRLVRPLAGDVQNLLGVQLNGIRLRNLLNVPRTNYSSIHMRRMRMGAIVMERPSINNRIDRV